MPQKVSIFNVVIEKVANMKHNSRKMLQKSKKLEFEFKKSPKFVRIFQLFMNFELGTKMGAWMHKIAQIAVFANFFWKINTFSHLFSRNWPKKYTFPSSFRKIVPKNFYTFSNFWKLPRKNFYLRFLSKNCSKQFSIFFSFENCSMFFSSFHPKELP